MALKLESAVRAIGYLDARISTTSVAAAWRIRASWVGYARALQLQGAEIDEIDILSWGCSLPLPSRPPRSTLFDEFAGFHDWLRQFHSNPRRHWAEGLPFTPLPTGDPPPPLLLRVFEVTRQHAAADSGIGPWVDVPLLIQRIGLTRSLLPCLVVGEKRQRLGGGAPGEIVTRLLADIGKASEAALARLEALEAHRAQSIAVLASERRPGALSQLLALVQSRPLVSPRNVAVTLGLTISGAGKLLARAAEADLMVEVSGRKAWRVYLVPDVAVELGLHQPKRGRPAAPPPLPEPTDPVHDVLAEFDRQMAAFDRRYGIVATPEDEGWS